MIDTKKPISYLEKFSYGMGDLAGNLMFALATSYLFYFYTDIAGIAVGTAGLIMSAARFVDAVSNPVVGVLIDKTDTRWGKTRPFILFTTLPLVVLCITTFLSPSGLSSTGKVVFALVTYVLYSILFTLSNVPYSTLMSNITDNEKERLSFNMWRTIGMSVGGLIATGATLPLVSFFGKTDRAKGYLITVIIYSLIAGFFLLLCFANTTERIKLAAPERQDSLMKAIRLAFKSKPWVALCFLQFLSFTLFSLRSSNMVYYTKYLLHQEKLAGVLLALPSVITIVLSLFIPKIALRIGKRNCCMIGYFINILGMLGVYVSGSNLPQLIACHVVAFIGTNFASAVFFVMSAETIDHSEWLTGQRQQGLLTAVTMFFVKIGIMLSGLLSSFVLARGGYVPDVEQSAASLAAIQMNYIWIPIIVSVFAIIASLFYDLDKSYRGILAELHERRGD